MERTIIAIIAIILGRSFSITEVQNGIRGDLLKKSNNPVKDIKKIAYINAKRKSIFNMIFIPLAFKTASNLLSFGLD